MKPLFRLAALLAFLLAPWAAVADSGSSLSGGGGGGGGGGNVTVVGPIGTSTAPAGAVSVSCVFGCQAGTVSNATSGVAATATNTGSVAWNYGFNGTTWDQLQVDASKFLKVNCAAGCTAAGTVSNASSAVATSATNSGAVSWLYGFNGTSWDQLQVDANKSLVTVLKQGAAVLSATNGIYTNILQGNLALSATNGIYVNLLQGNNVNGSGNPIFANITNGIVGTNSGTGCGASCMIGVQGNVTATDIPVSVAGTTSNAASGIASSATNVKTIAYVYGFNGTTWDQLQVDASKFLKINCATGCGSSGTVSNATSGVATSATNVGSVSWLYGFNGTTWDQLQVDASKFLKVNCATGCNAGTISNATSGVATSATNAGSVDYLYGFNGTTWDQLQVDASKFLKVNCSAGCTSGTVSNATSAVATSATNSGAVSWLYAFNGTTWDQLRDVSNSGSGVSSTSFNLGVVSYNYGYNGATWDQMQVDANKSLVTVLKQGAAVLGATNGIYTNLLQGNAALSVTNGIYANLLQGNNVLSAGNPLFVSQVGVGTIATVQVSVTSASTSVVAARTGAPGTGRQAVTCTNPGPTTVYVGVTGLTAANGHALLSGQAITLNTTAAIFAITGGASQTISCIETF